MLPLFKLIDNSKEYAFRDIVELLANEFKLTDSELREVLQADSKFISIILLVGHKLI